MPFITHGFTNDEASARLKKLEGFIQKNPTDVNALIETGFIHITVFEEPEDAQPYLERALELEPTNTDVLFWIANMHYHIGDERAAKKWLERILGIDSNRADCYDLLAEILYFSTENRNENIKKSFVYSKMAVQLEPTWVFPRTKLIDRLIREGDLDQAEKLTFDGIKLVEKLKLPAPKTRMKQYYEEYVTGRSDTTQKYFDYYLEEIEKRRSKLAKT